MRTVLRRVIIVLAVIALWGALRLTVLSDAGVDESAGLATLRVIDGRVELSRGGATFERVDSTADVDVGTKVRSGDDALAEIEYFDGSFTRIGPDTTYEIVGLDGSPNRSVIVGKIGLGETFHDVKDLTGSGSRFEVQESNAIAAVRGTRFAARCVPPLPCGIAVVEGVVEVTPSSGDPVSVEAGHRVTIDDDGILGEVTEVSPDDPWLNRNQDLDGAS